MSRRLHTILQVASSIDWRHRRRLKVAVKTGAEHAFVQLGALARQKYWQVRTNFTTLLLYNHNLNLDYKDYIKNPLASLNYLGFL